MDQNDGKITIQFKYRDQFGNEFENSTRRQVFPDLGDTDLSVIGEQFVHFLRQCGFWFNGDLLMEPLTDEEYYYLASKLEDYRAKARNDE